MTMTHIVQQQQQQVVVLGTIQVLVDDTAFVQGYETGYGTYHTYHAQQDDGVIEVSTLLFLLRNGWNVGQSDQWNTGYIMGWLAAFYEQEKGMFALSTYVANVGDAERDSRQQAS